MWVFAAKKACHSLLLNTRTTRKEQLFLSQHCLKNYCCFLFPLGMNQSSPHTKFLLFPLSVSLRHTGRGMKRCISELNLSSLQEVVAEVCGQSTESPSRQLLSFHHIDKPYDRLKSEKYLKTLISLCLT